MTEPTQAQPGDMPALTDAERQIIRQCANLFDYKNESVAMAIARVATTSFIEGKRAGPASQAAPKEWLEEARRCGATIYQNRHFPNEPAVAFGNESWAKFCAAISAPVQQAAGVPGFKLVPVEPTQAMLDAADKVIEQDPIWIARAYRAMLSASPDVQEKENG